LCRNHLYPKIDSSRMQEMWFLVYESVMSRDQRSGSKSAA
jgi:hypothetical protein